ncbi:hypothetical protein [Listeria booriae]|uniref:hypothetical protein n=1 Tax=Listeria booriae TaxID=1552123 RepID=UPI00162355AE|nr:hypothetical protein [Listeria booriae]MBC1307880.1 hypothetical protein [Listeria booriae]MBC1888046.1 hypothetical protein [Listeria booriae]MBC2148076.1 hypothetical protein [Listeria booriae]
MENKSEVKNDYVTQLDLLKHGDKLKKELNNNITKVSDEVSELKSLVLPLTASSQQTAKNTEKISDTLEVFVGNTTSHLHKHDLEISEMRGTVADKTEKKKGNTTIIVTIITVIGGIITGIIALAPVFWGG